MPIVGFLCTKTGRKIPFDEAPAYFDALEDITEEAIAALIAQEKDPRRTGPFLSPSVMNPDTTCRRQYVMQRYLDINMPPLVQWEALEGTLWHKVFSAPGMALLKDDKSLRELELPTPEHADHPRVKNLGTAEEPRWLYEMWPGVFIDGKLDKLTINGAKGILTDLKTTKYPKTYGHNPPKDYGPKNAKEDWPVQLSLYAHMAEDLLGIVIDKILVRRMYRGSHDRAYTWKKFTVGKWSKERLWILCENFVKTTTGWLEEAQEIKDNVADPEECAQRITDEVISKIPLDGKVKRMFNDTKCSKYCAVRPLCFKLAGEIDF